MYGVLMTTMCWSVPVRAGLGADSGFLIINRRVIANSVIKMVLPDDFGHRCF